MCTLNSRYVLPNVNLQSFACSPSSDNKTFEFATQLRIAKENEVLFRGFAQKEAKLEADALALQERESHYLGRAARLKVYQQNNDKLQKSLSEREREVLMREKQVAEKILQEEERLNKIKQAISLREQRLEERTRQLKESSHGPREYHEERAVPKHSNANARSPHNSSSLKRKNESLHQTPPPMHSNFHSLENTTTKMPSSQSKRRRSRINSNLEQLTPPQFKSDTNDTTNSNEEYPEQELNNSNSEFYADIRQQPHHQSSQESRFSQESSSQKRKRSNRGKSPVASQLDSLQSLPKSPKKQPKKVYIAFEE